MIEKCFLFLTALGNLCLGSNQSSGLWGPCSTSASGIGPRLAGSIVCLLSTTQSPVQAGNQARLEARREGESRGSLQQPLSSVLALIAGPRAMVASRDLWTQRKGEEQDKINQVNRQTPSPYTHTITEHRACPVAGDSGGECKKTRLSPSFLK